MKPFTIAVFVLLGIILFIAIILFILNKFGYKMFSIRSDGDLRFNFKSFRDYPNLIIKRVNINGYKNNRMNGIIASYKADKYKGTIIFYHGLYSGYLNYLNLIEYFAKHNYKVVAFDMIGNMSSAGKKVYGMALGDISNKLIIDFVKNNSELNSQPIYTVGHSWGGHLALTSLLHDDNIVKKAVGFSPYNSNVDCTFSIFKFLIVLSPFIYLLNLIKFGRYSTYKVTDALKYSISDIMICHGDKDNIVKKEYSLNKYKTCALDNAIIKEVKDGDHFLYMSNEGAKYFTDEISFPRHKPIGFSNLNYDLINSLNYELLDEVISFLDK